ncbi:hypothetical protein MINT15_02570 [Saccharomonospora viridis]|uniref:Uncharacterized protein n=1 Tax=Saccharomonospora viridis TaxID=1852 RepID=A0A837DJ81_9PSEU|nr:hypothetical protein MINT15_02570 [Saccharomonospora viridis]
MRGLLLAVVPPARSGARPAGAYTRPRVDLSGAKIRSTRKPVRDYEMKTRKISNAWQGTQINSV